MYCSSMVDWVTINECGTPNLLLRLLPSLQSLLDQISVVDTWPEYRTVWHGSNGNRSRQRHCCDRVLLLGKFLLNCLPVLLQQRLHARKFAGCVYALASPTRRCRKKKKRNAALNNSYWKEKKHLCSEFEPALTSIFCLSVAIWTGSEREFRSQILCKWTRQGIRIKWMDDAY